MALRERNPNLLQSVHNNGNPGNKWKQRDFKQDLKASSLKPVARGNIIRAGVRNSPERKTFSIRKVVDNVEGTKNSPIGERNQAEMLDSSFSLFSKSPRATLSSTLPTSKSICFTKTLNNASNAGAETFRLSPIRTSVLKSKCSNLTSFEWSLACLNKSVFLLSDCAFLSRNQKELDSSTAQAPKGNHPFLSRAYPEETNRIQKPSIKPNYSSVTKKNIKDTNYVVRNPSVPLQNCFHQNVKVAAPGLSLEEYGRALHRMGESFEEGAAEHAELLLREMLDKYSNGTHNIQPDGACYNSVIHAYAEAGKAEKAESVLRLMFQNYNEGNEKAEPNVRVYTNVLHAWRKAKAPNAPERCEAILKEMYQLSDTGALSACKPDTFAVTVSVIVGSLFVFKP
jgi:pentatricopeptide repeat protein